MASFMCKRATNRQRGQLFLCLTFSELLRYEINGGPKFEQIVWEEFHRHLMRALKGENTMQFHPPIVTRPPATER